MYLLKRCALLLLVFLVFHHIPTQGQQPASATTDCNAPSIANNRLSGTNIFTEQQEEWLGEIMAQGLEKDFHVIPDPEGHLEKIGARLLAQLPPTKVHYHFTIIDFPINNAFSIIGGRVYVARRLIALAKSEDDLAGVIAHEIGHNINHQIAIELSRNFMTALGVAQFSDRKDVFDKWNQLVDVAAKKKVKFEHDEQGEVMADRIGLYAMIRAGYDPRHAFDFFDRVTQMKGNTGGFWSDLFHQTKPESKRLREMLHNSAPMPQGCVTALAADNTTQFLAWQKAVVESQFAVAQEETPGLNKKTQLKGPLRGDLQQIQFSPDGNYLLAQDGSSIFVLSREPLANLFRIDAPESYQARFTPDSQSIVFYDKELRVQKWDVGKHERTWIHPVNLVNDCIQSSLSPSGEVLACVSPENDEAQFDLQLIDVINSQAIYTRKKLYSPNWYELYLLGLAEISGEEVKLFNLDYSPDDHYFVIGRLHVTLAYDLKNRSEIKLPKRLKEITEKSFTFLGPDKIAGYAPEYGPKKIELANFPSGESIDSFVAPAVGGLAAPGKGNYLLMMHSGKYFVTVVDLATKKLVTASKAAGFAIYDQLCAGETMAGEVAFINPADGKVLKHVALPESPLETTSASTFSNDGKWLAISGHTRGGIWNLETGDRIFLTLGFDGALFDQNQLIAEIPEKDPDPPRVVKMDIPTHTIDELYKVDPPKTSFRFTFTPGSFLGFRSFLTYTHQIGDLLVTVTPDLSEKVLTTSLDVRNIRTNKQLWERKVERETPQFYYSRAGGTLTLVFGDYDNIKAEAKADPNLRSKLNAIEGKKGKKDSYVLRAFDGMSGKNLGAVLVDTGDLSFKVRWANTIGDTVVVGDSKDRTLVYSLKTGEQKGKIAGQTKAISKAGDRILMDTGKGSADLYDLANLQPITHFTFPTKIIRAEFADDGNSIYVLTADQNVYNLKNPK